MHNNPDPISRRLDANNDVFGTSLVDA